MRGNISLNWGGASSRRTFEMPLSKTQANIWFSGTEVPLIQWETHTNTIHTFVLNPWVQTCVLDTEGFGNLGNGSNRRRKRPEDFSSNTQRKTESISCRNPWLDATAAAALLSPGVIKRKTLMYLIFLLRGGHNINRFHQYVTSQHLFSTKILCHTGLLFFYANFLCKSCKPCASGRRD